MALAFRNGLKQLQNNHHFALKNRCISSSEACYKSKESWFDKFMTVRKIDPGKDSHSRLLSASDKVYEIQINDVIPGKMSEYLDRTKTLYSTLADKEKNAELVGCWVVDVGNQDQSVSIWRYKAGYGTSTSVSNLLRQDEDILKINSERIPLLTSRYCQYLLAFSFWKEAAAREGPNMYELRSYSLKPGTMIEWGNNWARAIHYRQANNEAVAGYFSQVGKLYNVHHLWAYKDLMKRKEIREATWRKPGWDQCVAYTVPLIETMESRLMVPAPFSPLQ